MTMNYHVWPSELIPGIGVSQVPLILAWALTIHKAQGATLDAAEIDVGSGIFECGQTYVALSRVKSLNGLYLTSFDAKRIRINKKVKEYYESLDRSEMEKNRNLIDQNQPDQLHKQYEWGFEKNNDAYGFNTFSQLLKYLLQNGFKRSNNRHLHR